MTEPLALSCSLTHFDDARDRPTVLIIGDSHADALKESLKAKALRAGINLRLMKANVRIGGSAASVDNVAREIESRNVNYVLLHNRTPDGAVETAALIKGLEGLLSLSGKKRTFKILYVEPVPEWPVRIPEAVYQSLVKQDPGQLPERSLEQYYHVNDEVLRYVRSVASDRFVDFPVADRFCHPMCQMRDDQGDLLYHDEHHLTFSGTRVIDDVLQDAVMFVVKDAGAEAPASAAVRSPSVNARSP